MKGTSPPASPAGRAAVPAGPRHAASNRTVQAGKPAVRRSKDCMVPRPGTDGALKTAAPVYLHRTHRDLPRKGEKLLPGSRDLPVANSRLIYVRPIPTHSQESTCTPQPLRRWFLPEV